MPTPPEFDWTMTCGDTCKIEGRPEFRVAHTIRFKNLEQVDEFLKTAYEVSILLYTGTEEIDGGFWETKPRVYRAFSEYKMPMPPENPPERRAIYTMEDFAI